MHQTITILRQPWYPDDGRVEIDAEVEGHFAIHESIPATMETWTLTHVPTGYAIVTCLDRARCVKARAEIIDAGGDWSSSDTKTILNTHRAIGKAIQKKYGVGR